MIDNCHLQDGYSFTGAEDFLNALLLIVEHISSNSKLLMQLSEPLITLILPVLLQKTRGAGEGADIRFLSLKIFTDLVIQMLNDDQVYEPLKDNEQIVTTENAAVANTTRQLSDLL